MKKHNARCACCGRFLPATVAAHTRFCSLRCETDTEGASDHPGAGKSSYLLKRIALLNLFSVVT